MKSKDLHPKQEPTHFRDHSNPSGYVEPKEVQHGLSKEEFMEREAISYGMDLGDSCIPKKTEIPCPEKLLINKIKQAFKKFFNFTKTY